MNGGIRLADSAGVTGAILAALCCAGTPLILAALTGLGLGFLRKDAILWPTMLVSLIVALWGFWTGQKTHTRWGPFLMAGGGAGALVAGVMFIHGFPAKQIIAIGAVTLVIATVWNIVLRRSCTPAIA